MKTKTTRRIGRGHLVGAVVDVGFFVLLALLFRAHWILGLVAGGVLLAVIFGFMPLPGILFRELDEPAELPREKPARESPLLPLIGRIGTVEADLRPHGAVRVDDQRVEAKCSEGLVRAGERVRVTGVDHNAVLVELVVEEAGSGYPSRRTDGHQGRPTPDVGRG